MHDTSWKRGFAAHNLFSTCWDAAQKERGSKCMGSSNETKCSPWLEDFPNIKHGVGYWIRSLILDLLD